MTTRLSGSSDFPGSAKIYTFPPRGRFAPGGQRQGFEPSAQTHVSAGVKIASGSAWYHDAAIEEALNTEPRRT